MSNLLSRAEAKLPSAPAILSGGDGVLFANVDWTVSGLRTDVALFSESQSRLLLTCRPEQADALQMHLVEEGVRATRIGTVGGDKLNVTVNGAVALDIAVEQLEKTWKDAIPCLMK